MSLFGFGKKQEDKKQEEKKQEEKKQEEKKQEDKKQEASGCCCSGNIDAESMRAANDAVTKGESVKVLGSGCTKCNQLESNVKEALSQLGMDSEIEHVTDFAQIAAYGVMSTPALVVDGKVVSYGKVLKVEEAITLLKKIR
jgi:small redox-active disulfide protein 2